MLTVAVDINDSGVIVGRCTVAGITRGFIYEPGENGEDGTFTMLEVDGAVVTEAWGINERGDVIGQYLRPGDTRLHGFIRYARSDGDENKDEYVLLDRPGNFSVMAEDLNNAGFAVGCMHNAGTMHGWISRAGGPMSSSPAYQMFTGVNESGTVVGWGWKGEGINVGFVQSGVGRTEVRYQDSPNTQVWGVNQYGDVVGWFVQQNNIQGFLLRDGQFSTITKEGATWTRVFGINSAGLIVGAYNQGGTTRAFVFVPAGS